MIYGVNILELSGVAINKEEVARYSGAKTTDKALSDLIDGCVAEAEKENALTLKLCYAETPLCVTGDISDFGGVCFKSEKLSERLKNSRGAIVFAGTLGMEIDRLISRYSQINPVRALVFQSLGAERTETLIDAFSEKYEREKGVTLTPRFSPGYGDLPLSSQKDIFGFLNLRKNLGLTLNDSLLMSPSKSVTAIAGITCADATNYGKCELCEKRDCSFRSEK